jgi:Type I phosphodiesterase / nucleotide pyrophosphatase
MALSFSPAARRQLTNGLTAFSLATLCFIRRWYDLEHLQPRGLDYFRSGPASLALLGSTIAAATLLGAVFWGAWRWVEHSSLPWLRLSAQIAFLVVLMYPIESVRRYWNSQTDTFDIGSNVSLWAIEVILAAGIVALLLGSRRILMPARRVALLLLLLLPALIIDFVTNRLGAEQAEMYVPRPPASLLPSRGARSPRFVWVIFDELDQRLVFERRPGYLELPELDRLRGESVSANHAVETATFTAIALPSLISGRIFSSARAVDASTLEVVPQGSTQAVDWRSEPNVFTRSRSLGLNAAMVGWHHPYCRVLGDQLVDCFALPSFHSTAALAEEARASRDGVWRTVAWLFEWQLVNLRDMFRGGDDPGSERFRDAEIQLAQQQQYFQIRDHAYRYAADPRIDLVMLHIPAPHLLPIYNRRKGNFEITTDLDYFDNVALVDRTLGELRRAIEQAGLSDRTTLLISADHGLRPGAWIGRMGWTEELDRLTERQPPETVPFILKLAGQKQPIRVERPFSNVAGADLALAVLGSKVTTPEQAAAWMNQRASGEAPTQAAASRNPRSAQ